MIRENVSRVKTMMDFHLGTWTKCPVLLEGWMETLGKFEGFCKVERN